MGRVFPGFLLLTAVALGAGPACVNEAPHASLGCLRGCSQEKDACVLAAGNAAELSLCDVRQRRCNSECAP